MKEIKVRERHLLNQVCEKHNVNAEVLSELLKTAEKHAYENKTASVRQRELMEDLIYFSSNKKR